MDWHLRLGHLNVRDVMRLSKDGRKDGLEHVSGDDIHDFDCSSCILGKGRHLSSTPVEERAQQPLAVVHCRSVGSSINCIAWWLRVLLVVLRRHYSENTFVIHQVQIRRVAGYASLHLESRGHN